jgi:hypothetical protein
VIDLYEDRAAELYRWGQGVIPCLHGCCAAADIGIALKDGDVYRDLSFSGILGKVVGSG